MSCACDSGRVVHLGGKCSDLANISIPHLDFEHHGTMPQIGLVDGLGGDYIELTICLDCGKIQGWKEKTDAELTGMLVDEGLMEAEFDEFDDE